MNEPVWDDAELAERLSRIETRLSVLLQAQAGEGKPAENARNQLLRRYCGAVYRYFLGILLDANDAEELTQNFCTRFLQGNFKHFDPQRGRFRDYLKAALGNMAKDHWRRKKQLKEKGPQPLPTGAFEPVVETSPEDEFDREFLAKWKEELLARTWKALEKHQEESGSPYYTVLRCKAERPETRSAELATEVGARLGKPLTEESARQLVHRARKRFAELLVEEVARSLEGAEPERVSEELIELGLMGYCREAVEPGPGYP